MKSFHYLTPEEASFFKKAQEETSGNPLDAMRNFLDTTVGAPALPLTPLGFPFDRLDGELDETEIKENSESLEPTEKSTPVTPDKIEKIEAKKSQPTSSPKEKKEKPKASNPSKKRKSAPKKPKPSKRKNKTDHESNRLVDPITKTHVTVDECVDSNTGLPLRAGVISTVEPFTSFQRRMKRNDINKADCYTFVYSDGTKFEENETPKKGAVVMSFAAYQYQQKGQKYANRTTTGVTITHRHNIDPETGLLPTDNRSKAKPTPFRTYLRLVRAWALKNGIEIKKKDFYTVVDSKGDLVTSKEDQNVMSKAAWLAKQNGYVKKKSQQEKPKQEKVLSPLEELKQHLQDTSPTSSLEQPLFLNRLDDKSDDGYQQKKISKKNTKKRKKTVTVDPKTTSKNSRRGQIQRKFYDPVTGAHVKTTDYVDRNTGLPSRIEEPEETSYVKFQSFKEYIKKNNIDASLCYEFIYSDGTPFEKGSPLKEGLELMSKAAYNLKIKKEKLAAEKRIANTPATENRLPSALLGFSLFRRPAVSEQSNFEKPKEEKPQNTQP